MNGSRTPIRIATKFSNEFPALSDKNIYAASAAQGANQCQR